MRKIIHKWFLIAAMFFLSVTFTGAYLTDSESSVGNTFTAGTWAAPLQEPVINEVLSHPADSVSEWIEIKNNQSTILNPNGYTIQDGTTNVKNLNGYSIPANGYLVLNKGVDFTFGLNDPGDIIILKKTGNVIDQVAYGNWNDGNIADNAPSPGIDQSVARIPDGTDTNVDVLDFQIKPSLQTTKGGPNV